MRWRRGIWSWRRLSELDVADPVMGRRTWRGGCDQRGGGGIYYVDVSLSIEQNSCVVYRRTESLPFSAVCLLFEAFPTSNSDAVLSTDAPRSCLTSS